MFESRYDAMLTAESVDYLDLPLQRFGPANSVPRYFLPAEMLNIRPGPLPPEVRLPFDEFVLENGLIEGIAGFISVRKGQGDDHFVQVAYLLKGARKLVTPELKVVTSRWEVGGDFGVHLPGYVTERDRADLMADMKAGVDAVVQLVYLLSIRGIATKTVEAPAALNKKRVKHGKSPLSPYTLVKVGKVYDRQGNEVAEGERRTVTPHIRAGHSRMQPHGPHNTLRKPVFIPSTFVNYVDGAEIQNRTRVLTL